MAKQKPPQIRIGISGWNYVPWRGVFYPKGLAQHRELEYASRMVNSIEINGTFYSMQRPTSYQAWYDATPENFVFSLKGPRYITHMLKLNNAQKPLANFFASGVFALKEKMGPVLWQLPPNLGFNPEKLGAFFKLLPRDMAAAAGLAEQYDEKLKPENALTKIDKNRPIRYAMEVRHPSFADAAFVEVLREHAIAMVIADTAGRWPFAEDVTADFIYVRLHGDEELYASGYSPEALDRWAQRLGAMVQGKLPPEARLLSSIPPPPAKQRDLYVYFDNDVKVKAPFDAMNLAHRMGVTAQGSAQRGQPIVVSPKLTKKALAERVRSHWPGVVKRDGPV